MSLFYIHELSELFEFAGMETNTISLTVPTFLEIEGPGKSFKILYPFDLRFELSVLCK